MEKRTIERKSLIAIVGVESSGKSTIANELNAWYEGRLVEEYARFYLQKLNRPYLKEDLLEIARGQLAREEKAESSSGKMIVCDTTLLVIIVWSLYKYEHCDPKIIEWYKDRKYDLIFLTDWNIKWEEDPLRENPSPNERQAIQALYIKTLKSFQQPFVLLSGSKKDRFEQAIDRINSL